MEGLTAVWMQHLLSWSFQSSRGAGPLDGPSPRSPWSPYSLSGPALIFVPRPIHGRCPLVTCYLRDPVPHPGHRGSREAGFRVQIPDLPSGEERGLRDQRRGGRGGKWEEPGARRRVDVERCRGWWVGGAREPGASEDSQMGVSTPKTVGSLIKTTGGAQSD